MTYISFDDFSKDALHKEREACFIAGTNGEKLAQYITDAKEKHSKNANSLRHTATLFAEDEPKKRLHGKVSARLEQERKWVTHFDACASEHKKGQQVYKLKVELEETKKKAAKILADVRAANEQKLEETRKQCRIQYRAEFEAELKAKKDADKKTEEAKPKKGFWYWLNKLIGNELVDKIKDKPKPAPMVAKQAVPTNTSENKKREFLMMTPEERKARLDELRKRAAERAKEAAAA